MVEMRANGDAHHAAMLWAESSGVDTVVGDVYG